MRAAPRTCQLGCLCGGYTRRPGLAGLERRRGKGLGVPAGSPPTSPRGIPYTDPACSPLARLRRGETVPNRENRGGRGKEDASAPFTYEPKPLRPPRAPPAPARSRSSAPGLPAAPIGFRKRKERKGEVGGKGRAASVAGAGPVPNAGFSSFLAAGVIEHGGPWRPRERLHLPLPL